MDGNTSLPLSLICGGEVYSVLTAELGIQMAAFRFMMVSFVVVKVIRNFNALYENKLFAFYFLLLLSGGIVECSSSILLAVNHQYNADTARIDSLANTLELFGTILVDTFFGLMPNFFYSVYKTKLTEVSDKITQKYFFANGFVMGAIFIVFVISSFAASNAVISSNVIIIVEISYSFSFYVLVVVELRKLEGRIQKVIWRYFSYFSLYSITIIIRNSFLIISYVVGTEYVDLSFLVYPFDTVCSGVQLLVVAMFLKEIKFSIKKRDKSTGNSQPSSLQNTSQ